MSQEILNALQPYGLAGLALVVFLLIVKRFDIKLSKLSVKTSGIFALTLLAIVALVIVSAILKPSTVDTQVSEKKEVQPKPINVVKFEHNGEVTLINEMERNVQYDILTVESKSHIWGIMSVHDWIRTTYPNSTPKEQALMMLKANDKEIPMDKITIKLKSGKTKLIYVNNEALWQNSQKSIKEKVSEDFERLYGIKT